MRRVYQWIAITAFVMTAAVVIITGASVFLAELLAARADFDSAWTEWKAQAKRPAAMFRRLIEDKAVHQFALPVGTLVLCGLGAILMSGGAQPRRPGMASTYGSHGTSRWATTGEIISAFTASGPGAVIGRIRRGFRWHPLIHSFNARLLNRFVCIIGPPGSGKTSRYTLTNLLHAAACDQKRTIVATDPKGELHRHTAKLFAEKGWQVRVINLDNPTASDRYNPLDAVHTLEEAMRLANTIIANTGGIEAGNDPFWVNAEKTLLACLIWYVKSVLPPEHQHLATVLTVGNAFANDPGLMDAAFSELPHTHGARQLYSVIAALTDKTRDGVFVGFAVRLQLWTSEQIAALTAASDFSIRDLGTTPTVLYLIIPDHHSTYRALTSLFFDQVFQELISEAERHGGRLPTEVRILLEEMANIGRIPELEKRLATIRSRGIIVEMVLQTLGQLRSLYGDAWSTIVGCADTMLVLAANDMETAEYVSKRLGTATIRTNSASQTSAERGHSESMSQHYTSRPLMLPDEVLGQGGGGLRPDELLVIQRGLFPARVRKFPYDQHPLAKGLQDADPAEYKAPKRDPLTLLDPYQLSQLKEKPAWRDK